MPINSMIITARPEEQEQDKTYFITTDERTVFVKTTKSKIHSLLTFIETLGVEIKEWGEMSDFGDIYEF